MTGSEDHGDSVLDKLTPIMPNARAEADYEAALEGINRVIGRLSRLIAAEENSKKNTDQTRLDTLLEQQTEWARVARDLRTDDSVEVSRVRRECARLLAGPHE